MTSPDLYDVLETFSLWLLGEIRVPVLDRAMHALWVAIMLWALTWIFRMEADRRRARRKPRPARGARHAITPPPDEVKRDPGA